MRAWSSYLALPTYELVRVAWYGVVDDVLKTV